MKILMIKEELMSMLRNELPVLRARLGISQAKLAEMIGISRQTYNVIENGKREMTWPIFLSLVAFFQNNEQTGDMDISSPRQRRECIEQLTNTIISKWYGAIRNDLLENEINDDDLKEAGIYEPAYREGRRLEHLYGTTLMAALPKCFESRCK